MKNNRYLKKLFFKQWVIGVAEDDIREIIRKRSFSQRVSWVKPWSSEYFQADPFIIGNDDETVSIIFEEFSMNENYGNISLMVVDKEMNVIEKKILLDTGSHLSFPYVFKAGGKIFIIPESVRNGKVTCYEFLKAEKRLVLRGDLVQMPLYDPAVLFMKNKYWLFGSVFENRKIYNLHVYYSDSLLGTYTPLPGNPVSSGLDGVRSAGAFFEVDGSIFRPAQNCANRYGDSITVNRLSVLNENEFIEEPYMKITINDRNRKRHNIETIHTLNVSGNKIVVDGMRWELSLTKQLNNYFRNRKHQAEQIENRS